MKPATICSIAASAALLASTADAHGQMLVPSYRPITATYLADCLFGLKGAGDDELEWAPIENLSQRGQADQPAAATFNIYNGCRGIVYEDGMNVTAIEAGVEFDVEYYIQAPHPGYMNLSIVKPSTDSTGTITYEVDTQIAHFDDFATASGTFTVQATIPTTVTGCESAGDCALQFYWYSATANQTYPTCSDITIAGSGSGSTSTTTVTTTSTASSASASAATTSSAADDTTTTTTTTAPATTTATPTTTTATPTTTTATATTTTTTTSASTASASEEDDEEEDDESASVGADADETTTTTETTAPATTTAAPATTTAAPATTTAAPATTTAAPSTSTTTTTTTTSDKCSVRRRRD
jgi:hypothetical protein